MHVLFWTVTNETKQNMKNYRIDNINMKKALKFGKKSHMFIVANAFFIRALQLINLSPPTLGL